MTLNISADKLLLQEIKNSYVKDPLVQALTCCHTKLARAAT